MKKYYCDKCGVEIKEEEECYVHLTYLLEKSTTPTEYEEKHLSRDFCKECREEIIKLFK